MENVLCVWNFQKLSEVYILLVSWVRLNFTELWKYDYGGSKSGLGGPLNIAKEIL